MKNIAYTPTTLALLCLLTSLAAQAGGAIDIRNAWARATAPGQEVGAAYMDLKSVADAVLVKAESPAADFVEIHQMSMKNGAMKMRMLEKMPLPAGKVVKLEPGGFHLMLIDLKQPLEAGKKVELTLHIKDSRGKISPIKVELPVKKGTD